MRTWGGMRAGLISIFFSPIDTLLCDSEGNVLFYFNRAGGGGEEIAERFRTVDSPVDHRSAVNDVEKLIVVPNGEFNITLHTITEYFIIFVKHIFTVHMIFLQFCEISQYYNCTTICKLGRLQRKFFAI